MSEPNETFCGEFQPGYDYGAADPGKLEYLHNADWTPTPSVQLTRVDSRACPGCMFPDAAPGKWPHTKDARCKLGKVVPCAKCGGDMFVILQNLGFYYDCGLMHAGGCPQ